MKILKLFIFLVVINLALFTFVILSPQDETVGASIITVKQGGTGNTSFNAGECLIGNGTSAITTGVCGTGGGDGTSPLTTKGDLYTYSSTSTRLAVGTDGYVLKANSATVTGLEWVATSTLGFTGTGGTGTFEFETATATAAQTTFDIVGFTYTVGSNQLEVFVNGVYQLLGDSYTETDNNTIEFLSGLNAGDRVAFAIRGGATVTAGEGSGTVTSVAMTVPTGLSVSGSPITDSGTLAVSLTSGYIIPLSASTTQWNTAYNWGNHATAGYLTTYTETDPVWIASSSLYLKSATALTLFDVLGQATSTLAGHTTAFNHTNFLSTGGTLTSGNLCRYDGSGIDCDRAGDASGDCGANLVCMGGHTHSTYLTAVASDSTWTTHNSYPSACTQGVVTAIGDTLTCTATSSLGIVSGANQTPWTSNIDGGGYSLSNVLNATTTNLTVTSTSKLGTIISGTWNGSTIGVGYGGTGITSATAGYTLIGLSATAFQATSTLFFSVAGNVGVGTTTPQAKFVVDDGTSATTTITVGDSLNASCLELEDNDKGGYTYCVVLNGTMSCGTTSCR